METNMALEMMKAIFWQTNRERQNSWLRCSMNALIKVEREQHIGAKGYEGAESRDGY